MVQGQHGTFSNPMAFTGEPLDANGLQYHRARYYAPTLGIFPSLDPFEGMMGRPMSLNGYSWVEGNPVMNVDPSGKTAQLAKILNNGVCQVQSDPCSDPNYVALNPFRCEIPTPSVLGSREFDSCMGRCLISFDREGCVRRCMERESEQKGGCRIEIYSYNVNYLTSLDPDVPAIPFLQPDHAFIVYWNEQENGTVYRGLPAGAPLSGTAIINVSSHPHDLDNGDYDTWLQHGGAGPFIVSVGQDACNKKRCLDRQINRMNELAVTYHAVNQNSNTAAKAFLASCDLPVVDIGNNFSQALPGFRNDVLVDPAASPWIEINF